MHTDYGGDDLYMLKSGANIRFMQFDELFRIVCGPHRASYVVKEVTEEVMDEMPPAVELAFCEMYDHVVSQHENPEPFLSTYDTIWKWLEGDDD